MYCYVRSWCVFAVIWNHFWVIVCNLAFLSSGICIFTWAREWESVVIFLKTNGSVIKKMFAKRWCRRLSEGHHGGERGELGEGEEYSRNKQDQAINRSNSWQGTLKKGVQCCSIIVSKDVHPSEFHLHHIKVISTSDIFLMSHFTRTITCPLLCTLG